MAKRISKEEYEGYFNEKASVIEYTSISGPAAVKCRKCGKLYKDSNANRLLKNFICCSFVSSKKQNDKIHVCEKCGFAFRITSSHKCPKCKYIFGSTTSSI